MNKIFLAFLIVFTSAQALALPSAPELIDQFQLVDQIYNVVIDDIIKVDETTGFQNMSNKKSGYLEVHLSIYKENGTEYTPSQGRAMFLTTVGVCKRLGNNPQSHAHLLEPGYELDFMEDRISVAIDGVLSDDKKTYSGGCKILYSLSK